MTESLQRTVATPERAGAITWQVWVVRLLALTVLFSAAAVYESWHLWSLTTPEIWVHLRTGSWIWQNHAIPRSGLFSQYPNILWNDSTWAFDALLGAAYDVFGLRTIPILMMLLKAALAVSVFVMARSARASFWSAVALSAAAQYVIAGLQPLPYVFSILFFAVELQVLMGCRRSGSSRNLFWLSALFLIWANLHIQFVAGLALFGLFLLALCIEHALRSAGVSWLSRRIIPLPLSRVSVALGCSVLATLMNPYTFRLAPAAFKALYTDVAFEHFSEMSSMSFRRPQEFLLMLMVMLAFLALGRLRSLEVFELLTLVAGTAIAFRIQRDGWIVVLPSIAVLANGFLADTREHERVRRRSLAWAVAGATACILLIGALRLPGRDAMWNKISQNFPVKACDAIVANRLAPPLFNAYSWGSFVTWYLPQYPVVVDSRVEMYGDGILSEYFDVVGGKERLDTHPMFSRARTLLLERNSAIGKALMNLPGLKSQYRLVYSDEVSVVFVPTSQ